MMTPQRYWFPAKRRGWGWGPPGTWQGWVVIAVFALLSVAGIFVFPPDRDIVALIIWFVTLNVGLMTVCWLKGEPPGRGDRR